MNGNVEISVVIPTIPKREAMLDRALRSVERAMDNASFGVEILVEKDDAYAGPSVTRNRAMAKAKGTYVTFLDDDDEMYPDHLIAMHRSVSKNYADVVYPWYDVAGPNRRVNNSIDPGWVTGPVGTHPNPAYKRRPRTTPFGKPFSADDLRDHAYIPVVSLIRREAIDKTEGFPLVNSGEWPYSTCEDWGFYLSLLNSGAVFSHLPERTWLWHHHGKNTSGLPARARKL